MFEKSLNPDTIDPKHIETAYALLKKYCDEQKVDVVTFVSNPANITPAATHIHKELPFAYRMLLSKSTIEKLITSNIEFIKQKAQELSKRA